jgi:hypothetical protein
LNPDLRDGATAGKNLDLIGTVSTEAVEGGFGTTGNIGSEVFAADLTPTAGSEPSDEVSTARDEVLL